MRIRKAYQGTVPENKILDTYSTSQTDTYSCNFVNGDVLYNNTSGATGTIELSDNISNYSYIEIFYKNNNNLYGYSKVYSPSGKIFVLSLSYPDTSSNQIWVQSTAKTVSGTSMTTVNGRYAEAEVYSKSGFGRNDRIAIVRIVGHK